MAILKTSSSFSRRYSASNPIGASALNEKKSQRVGWDFFCLLFAENLKLYQQDHWVKAQIDAGHYTNESEFIRDLIRREQERSFDIEDIRAALTEGGASGEPEPLATDHIIALACQFVAHRALKPRGIVNLFDTSIHFATFSYFEIFVKDFTRYCSSALNF